MNKGNITPEEISKIQDALRAGNMSQARIAHMFGVSAPVVSRINHNMRHGINSSAKQEKDKTPYKPAPITRKDCHNNECGVCIACRARAYIKKHGQPSDD